MKKPIGTINGVYFFESDLRWTRKFIREAKAAREKYTKLAKTARPRACGAYAQKARQAETAIKAHQANLDALLARVGKFGSVISPSRGGDWIP